LLDYGCETVLRMLAVVVKMLSAVVHGFDAGAKAG